MLALISDIHGNLEALDSVTANTDGLEIVCLGDVVCYGPDSIECVRKSSAWKSTIAGPMDLALLDHDTSQCSTTIKGYIDRLRQQLNESSDSESLIRILQSYVAEFTSDGRWYYHGAPGSVRDYIFPESIYCKERLDQMVDHPQHTFIGGGSHIPGLFRRSGREWEFMSPENGIPYDLPPDEKTIVTIGSVGQPRDGDPRASYAIVDDTSIVFHRVDYDQETTRRKINHDPDIDACHGERLPFGR